MKIIDINRIEEAIRNRSQRSAWDKGVTLYALEIIEELRDRNGQCFDISAPAKLGFMGYMLTQGYDAWIGYSRGGSGLVYCEHIAQRLCTPSEYRKAEKNGFFTANPREDWLDVQGRAMFQARNLICKAIRESLPA